MAVFEQCTAAKRSTFDTMQRCIVRFSVYVVSKIIWLYLLNPEESFYLRVVMLEQFIKLISEHNAAINVITTVVTAVVAVIGIFLTRSSIRAAKESNRIATDQFQYERNQDKVKEERSQAVLVSVWINSGENKDHDATSGQVVVAVNNAGNQPVYDVVITTGAIQGAAPSLLTGDGAAVPVGILPPGQYEIRVPMPSLGMHTRFNAAIGFTDASGQSWTRDAAGELSKIEKNPYEYFDLSLPIAVWGALTPLR